MKKNDQNKIKKEKIKEQMSANENEAKPVFLPIYMSIGLSVGVALGAAFDKIPLYMCIGLSIGVGIGALIDANNRKKGDKRPILIFCIGGIKVV